jgi:hypothetical protein
VWKRLQGKRSSRDGMSVSLTADKDASDGTTVRWTMPCERPIPGIRS